MPDPDIIHARSFGVLWDGPIEKPNPAPDTPASDPLAHLRARDYVSIQVRDLRRILLANQDHAAEEAKYRDAAARWCQQAGEQNERAEREHRRAIGWCVGACVAAVVALVMGALLVGVVAGW